MSVLYVALPLAIALGGAALIACVRCIRSGQYDDLETPPVRILIDEPLRYPPAEPPPAVGNHKSNKSPRSPLGRPQPGPR